jgi:CxxH/CxxC protein (TIGR04129 family)
LWITIDKLCISLWKSIISKGRNILKIYSCETHIGYALDMFVATEKEVPIMEKVDEEKKLSTKCNYCDEQATYIVANK